MFREKKQRNEDVLWLSASQTTVYWLKAYSEITSTWIKKRIVICIHKSNFCKSTQIVQLSLFMRQVRKSVM